MTSRKDRHEQGSIEARQVGQLYQKRSRLHCWEVDTVGDNVRWPSTCILSEYYHQDLSPEKSLLRYFLCKSGINYPSTFYGTCIPLAQPLEYEIVCPVFLPKIHFLYSVLKVFSLPLEKKFEKKISFLDISHMLCYTLFC